LTPPDQRLLRPLFVLSPAHISHPLRKAATSSTNMAHAAAAAATPRKKRDRTPQQAASRDHSRWLDDFHSSEDKPPFFAWGRQQERQEQRRQRRQQRRGQASSISGAVERLARDRASGTPRRADEEEEEGEDPAARDSSRTTSRRRGGQGGVDVSETYLSEYQVCLLHFFMSDSFMSSLPPSLNSSSVSRSFRLLHISICVILPFNAFYERYYDFTSPALLSLSFFKFSNRGAFRGR